jgi:predicted GNAT family N-acyltransferase
MKTVRHTKNDPEFELSWKIRVEVFVEEQNVPIGLEMDEYDETAVHVLAYDNEEPVGCGRIVFFDQYAQIGRVAVLQRKRKLGVGKLVCEALMLARSPQLTWIKFIVQMQVSQCKSKSHSHTFNGDSI